jgi:hypothetical protein
VYKRLLSFSLGILTQTHHLKNKKLFFLVITLITLLFPYRKVGTGELHISVQDTHKHTIKIKKIYQSESKIEGGSDYKNYDKFDNHEYQKAPQKYWSCLLFLLWAKTLDTILPHGYSSEGCRIKLNFYPNNLSTLIAAEINSKRLDIKNELYHRTNSKGLRENNFTYGINNNRISTVITYDRGGIDEIRVNVSKSYSNKISILLIYSPKDNLN